MAPEVWRKHHNQASGFAPDKNGSPRPAGWCIAYKNMFSAEKLKGEVLESGSFSVETIAPFLRFGP